MRTAGCCSRRSGAGTLRREVRRCCTNKIKRPMNWNTLLNWNALLNSVVYSLVGIVVFCVGFIAVDKMTKYDLWDELINKKNMALAIVVGFVSLGISIIIAAAIHG